MSYESLMERLVFYWTHKDTHKNLAWANSYLATVKEVNQRLPNEEDRKRFLKIAFEQKERYVEENGFR